MNPKQFSVDQFAQAAAVSRRTVANWLASNSIPGAFKLGGRWRIPEAAIEQMKRNPYDKGAR